MSKGKAKNCRLCLEILDDDYNAMEEITREIFKVLLIKIDLSVTEYPLVCKSCLENAQEAFNFKSTCLAVDKQIVAFATGRSSAELDIRDVYLKENENKNVVFNDDYNICRFCLQCLEKSNFNLLNDLKQNSIDEILLKCIPELDLNIMKEPVVCTACLISLERYYRFALKCHLTEENIIKYRELQGAECTGHISLANVLKFLIKGEYIDSCSRTPEFEKHDVFQDEGNLHSGTNDIVFKIEEEELTIKDEIEYGDCKVEENRGKEAVNLDMLTHKDPVDAVTFGCDSCTFETKYKKYLKMHMLVHKDNSEVTIYKCEMCTFATKRKNYLSSHMLTHKDKSEVTMYKCNLCSYETKWKKYLKNHKLIHKEYSDVVMYRCELCTYETKHKNNLNTHLSVHKDNSDMVMYKCNLCSYKAKWKYRLKDHMLIHKDSSEVVMFKCEKCTYETKNNKYLKKHMFIHRDTLNVTMYKCSLCSYEGRWNCNLKKHMLKHNDSADVVMYKCERCRYKTKYEKYLNRHMRVHKHN